MNMSKSIIKHSGWINPVLGGSMIVASTWGYAFDLLRIGLLAVGVFTLVLVVWAITLAGCLNKRPIVGYTAVFFYSAVLIAGGLTVPAAPDYSLEVIILWKWGWGLLLGGALVLGGMISLLQRRAL